MSTISACPGCGAELRSLRPTCRACGTLLFAPPPPVGSADAAENPGTPGGAPSTDEQFFAPAVLQPIVQLPPAASAAAGRGSLTARRSGISTGADGDTGKWIVLAAMMLFLVAAVAAAYFTLKPAASKQADTPVVLAPRPASEGLPSGLGTVVRIQAESARRTALQAIEQVGSGDIVQLAAAQPGFRWVPGGEASTDAHTISVASGSGVVTVAIAASNHDVCAFGQWTVGGRPRYVTMGNQPACAAAGAPTHGWSSEPGGAASDLPDATG